MSDRLDPLLGRGDGLWGSAHVCGLGALNRAFCQLCDIDCRGLDRPRGKSACGRRWLSDAAWQGDDFAGTQGIACLDAVVAGERDRIRADAVGEGGERVAALGHSHLVIGVGDDPAVIGARALGRGAARGV